MFCVLFAGEILAYLAVVVWLFLWIVCFWSHAYDIVFGLRFWLSVLTLFVIWCGHIGLCFVV